jgi:hypothetical protein
MILTTSAATQAIWIMPTGLSYFLAGGAFALEVLKADVLASVSTDARYSRGANPNRDPRFGELQLRSLA